MVAGKQDAGTKLRRIPVMGIVGGIGSGKSAVAKWVATQANVEVIDADQLGHEALREPAVIEALCQQFGRSILRPNGEIERSEVAKLVFGPDAHHLAAREALEKIVHPEIGRQISQRIDQAASGGRGAVLLDAAVLLEAGWKIKCDAVIFIETPDAIRQARVFQNRGWSPDELHFRESSQWTLPQKRREADFIVTNERDVATAGKQLLDLLIQQRLLNANPEG